jgi:hypothetical protein
VTQAFPVVFLRMRVAQWHPNRCVVPRHLIPRGRNERIFMEKSDTPRGRFVTVFLVERRRPSGSSPIIPMFNHLGLAQGRIPIRFGIRIRVLVFTRNSRERDDRTCWGLRCSSSSTATADAGVPWRQASASEAAEQGRTDRPNAFPPLKNTIDQSLAHGTPSCRTDQQSERHRRGLRNGRKGGAMQNLRRRAGAWKRAT